MDREQAVDRLLAGPHPHHTRGNRDITPLIRATRRHHGIKVGVVAHRTDWQSMVDGAIKRIRTARASSR